MLKAIFLSVTALLSAAVYAGTPATTMPATAATVPHVQLVKSKVIRPQQPPKDKDWGCGNGRPIIKQDNGGIFCPKGGAK